MKKLVLAFIVFAATTINAAYSAEIEGTVESVDIDNMMITLADGNEYKVSQDIPLELLAEGANVILNTDDDGTATDIMLID
jgi:hypothetical protein